MVVYISTSCLKNNKDVTLVLEEYQRIGIKNVELGSFHNYIDDLSVLESYDFNYLVHNYFPPAKDPIILNLASQSNAILNKTIDIFKNSIDVCSRLNCPIYSFHPPYRQDPNLKFEFSRKREIHDYEVCFKTFQKGIKVLEKYASNIGIILALENNIAHTVNYGDVRDFSMLIREDEFLRIFNEINSENFKMLLDLGHLKVNAYWLKFQPFDYINTIKDHIACLHLHDNDGKTDSHSIINESSWVIDVLKKISFKQVPKIIECQKLDKLEILKVEKIINSLD